LTEHLTTGIDVQDGGPGDDAVRCPTDDVVSNRLAVARDPYRHRAVGPARYDTLREREREREGCPAHHHLTEHRVGAHTTVHGGGLEGKQCSRLDRSLVRDDKSWIRFNTQVAGTVDEGADDGEYLLRSERDIEGRRDGCSCS